MPIFSNQKHTPIASSSRSSYSPTTPTIETPTSHYHRASIQSNNSTAASARRLSRFTATSSSGSSFYSTDSEGAKAYRITEKPDISTVYEEEGTVENEEDRHHTAPLRQVKRQASQSTFQSFSHTLPSQHVRDGTISSTFSNRSDSSRRPLLGASLQSNHPKLLQVRLPQLQPSRSSPNLRAMFKDGQAPAHSVRLAEDSEDEVDLCPVCAESLNSSFKLPGEKPHIVPECGHALHEVSTQVYRTALVM